MSYRPLEKAAYISAILNGAKYLAGAGKGALGSLGKLPGLKNIAPSVKNFTGAIANKTGLGDIAAKGAVAANEISKPLDVLNKQRSYSKGISDQMGTSNNDFKK